MAYGDLKLSDFASEWGLSLKDARELFRRHDLPIGEGDVCKVWDCQAAHAGLLRERWSAEQAAKVAK